VATVVPGDDILVFPENHHGFLATFAAWPNRKVVFCQNQYMVIRGLEGCRDYTAFGVSGILCVGRYVAEYCRMRFPYLPVALVPVYIDQQLFRPLATKRLQIAFAPHKRPMEAAFIRDLFRARNPQFESIPWVEVSGATEKQVAGLLNETAICLALCRYEACPLTILEALAAGCVTVGFTGFGARQYTTARNGFWVGEDDCLDCAEQLGHAVRVVVEGGPLYHDLVEAGLGTARDYSRDRMVRSVVGFWEGFLRGTVFGS
jgi:hypothetical protein